MTKKKSVITYFFITLVVFFVFFNFIKFLFSLVSLTTSEAINVILSPKNIAISSTASVIYAIFMAYLIKKKEKEISK